MTTGSCLCGTVRWRIEGPYRRMTHCHCSMCRKAHAAPFATYIIVDRDCYEILSGADAVTAHASSSAFRRSFCSHCGSVTPFDAGDHVAVPAGCLDDDPGIRPDRHIFAASKAPWHGIADDLPQASEYKLDTPPPVTQADGPASEPAILRGSCLCGGVAYEAATPILAVYNCHCSRCRKRKSLGAGEHQKTTLLSAARICCNATKCRTRRTSRRRSAASAAPACPISTYRGPESRSPSVPSTTIPAVVLEVTSSAIPKPPGTPLPTICRNTRKGFNAVGGRETRFLLNDRVNIGGWAPAKRMPNNKN